MTGERCRTGVDGKDGVDVERLTTLTEIIDWAEGEAAALNAPDVGMCLQLARLALLARAHQVT